MLPVILIHAPGEAASHVSPKLFPLGLGQRFKWDNLAIFFEYIANKTQVIFPRLLGFHVISPFHESIYNTSWPDDNMSKERAPTRSFV